MSDFADPAPPPPPRLLPDRELPAYAHTPGVTPHPIREPEGHSYGLEHPHVSEPESARWRECTPYVWGIDLFNAGYYWEAHEAWEAAWIAAGRRGSTADFLKALIKLAAAGVKLREGVPAGARRHLRRADELLTISSGIATDDGLFGLELPPLQQACRKLLANALPEVKTDLQPVPMLGIHLIPKSIHSAHHYRQREDTGKIPTTSTRDQPPGA